MKKKPTKSKSKSNFNWIRKFWIYLIKIKSYLKTIMIDLNKNEAFKFIKYILIFILTLIFEYLFESVLAKIVTASILLILGIWMFIYYLRKYNNKFRPIIYALLLTIFIVFVSYHFGKPYMVPPHKCENPETLQDHFDCISYNDSTTVLIATVTLVNSKDGTKQQLKYNLHCDFRVRSCYLNIYVPKANDVLDKCIYFATRTDSIVATLKTKPVTIEQGTWEYATLVKDLVFTHRVFIYHETPLLASEKSELTNLFLQNNHAVIFYGSDLEFLKKKKGVIIRENKMENLNIP